ncbi:hypothetical protein D3C81_1558250 [compost metagenome]
MLTELFKLGNGVRYLSVHHSFIHVLYVSIGEYDIPAFPCQQLADQSLTRPAALLLRFIIIVHCVLHEYEVCASVNQVPLCTEYSQITACSSNSSILHF